MNLPDKNPIWETFADNYDEKVKILYALNEYEAVIKPEIKALEAKIGQLEIEKIELNANFEQAVKGQRDTIVLFEKDEVELRAENKRLREALRPFAEAFEPRTNVDQDDEIQRAFDRNSCTPQMTMGDFRKAAKVLEGKRK